jgi:hypothetical protein
VDDKVPYLNNRTDQTAKSKHARLEQKQPRTITDATDQYGLSATIRRISDNPWRIHCPNVVSSDLGCYEAILLALVSDSNTDMNLYLWGYAAAAPSREYVHLSGILL